MIKNIKTIDEAVEYIYSIPRFTVSNNFEYGKGFLKYIGNPDKRMKIIHVAGTNGKGSVCAYMNSILREAGYKVGLFISPHLVDIRERFIVNDEMISEDEFMEAFNYVTCKLDEYNKDKIDEKYAPTYFEYMFLICMQAFSKYELDYCILETGLGGRLDATNTVADKELCIITRIGLDHTEYLGDTIEKIATEKAGIIRKDVTTVYLAQDEVVSKVYMNSGNTKLIGVAPPTDNEFEYDLTSIATYQKENAALAVAACKSLDMCEEDIRAGLKKCVWAGRMEEILPNVYVDGAHNDDGIRAFLETVSKDGFTGKRTLVFSAVKDKDYASMVSRLLDSSLFTQILVAPLETSRGLSVDELENAINTGLNNQSLKMLSFENVGMAFDYALEHKECNERIYVAGSLYLVGEVKQHLMLEKG